MCAGAGAGGRGGPNRKKTTLRCRPDTPPAPTVPRVCKGRRRSSPPPLRLPLHALGTVSPAAASPPAPCTPWGLLPTPPAPARSGDGFTSCCPLRQPLHALGTVSPAAAHSASFTSCCPLLQPMHALGTVSCCPLTSPCTPWGRFHEWTVSRAAACASAPASPGDGFTSAGPPASPCTPRGRFHELLPPRQPLHALETVSGVLLPMPACAPWGRFHNLLPSGCSPSLRQPLHALGTVS